MKNQGNKMYKQAISILISLILIVAVSTQAMHRLLDEQTNDYTWLDEAALQDILQIDANPEETVPTQQSEALEKLSTLIKQSNIIFDNNFKDALFRTATSMIEKTHPSMQNTWIQRSFAYIFLVFCMTDCKNIAPTLTLMINDFEKITDEELKECNSKTLNSYNNMLRVADIWINKYYDDDDQILWVIIDRLSELVVKIRKGIIPFEIAINSQKKQIVRTNEETQIHRHNNSKVCTIS